MTAPRGGPAYGRRGFRPRAAIFWGHQISPGSYSIHIYFQSNGLAHVKRSDPEGVIREIEAREQNRVSGIKQACRLGKLEHWSVAWISEKHDEAFKSDAATPRNLQPVRSLSSQFLRSSLQTSFSHSLPYKLTIRTQKSAGSLPQKLQSELRNPTAFNPSIPNSTCQNLEIGTGSLNRNLLGCCKALKASNRNPSISDMYIY